MDTTELRTNIIIIIWGTIYAGLWVLGLNGCIDGPIFYLFALTLGSVFLGAFAAFLAPFCLLNIIVSRKEIVVILRSRCKGGLWTNTTFL
jgi:hypothetical protein